MTHKEFEQKAREHQVEFMKRYGDDINCYRTSDPLSKSDNPDKEVWLTMENARKGLVFCDCFRDEILQLPNIRRRIERKPVVNTSGRIKQDLMLSVTLRSEHIPYNLFFPLIKEKDKPYVAEIFNRMVGFDKIEKVNDIIIEYAPKPKGEYINDSTSFDVYVDYTDKDGLRGGIGIEVKYTEKEYFVKTTSKEWLDTHDEFGKPQIAEAYKVATEKSGYYKEGVEGLLVTDYLRQIWRNHILGASMVQRGDLANFISLTIYPAKNSHFTDAGAVYRSVMTEHGNSTFGTITYEDYIAILKDVIKDKNSAAWIQYLEDRYLFP